MGGQRIFVFENLQRFQNLEISYHFFLFSIVISISKNVKIHPNVSHVLHLCEIA